jgi:hypothetical protein
MQKTVKTLVLITAVIFVSCKENVNNSNEIVNTPSDLEYLNQIEEREKGIVEMRELMGISSLNEIIPNSKSDIYFRSIKYLPYNKPIEIKTITNVGVPTPTLIVKTLQFDYQCNPVSGKKKLNKDCFKIIANSSKTIKNTDVDSLLKLLDKTEFWNLRRSTYNFEEMVVMDGVSIEFSGVRGKSLLGVDSIGIHSNSIERVIPERYLGVSLLDDFMNTLK